MSAHDHSQAQSLQDPQDLLTSEQAQEPALLQTPAAHAFQEQDTPQQVPSGFTTGGVADGSAQQQMVPLSQGPQAPASNPVYTVHHIIQAQHSLQLNMLVAQGRQQNGFASRVGQSLHPPGMGLPQGQGSLEQNFIQPSPSVPPANLQSSVPAPASHPTQLGGPQVHGLPRNIAEMITLKRQGGEPAQQAANGTTWLGAGQWATRLSSVPERPSQQNNPINQASVNQIQIPPQVSIPTPQQNFVPSVTAQSNLTQMSSHVFGNGLSFNGPPAQIRGAPQQPPPQAPHPHPQQIVQCSKFPLPEDRFKALFAQFANTTGIRLNDRDFVIDGRPISPWALHRAVFARNGFDFVTANDEWPVVGAALGFPPFSAGDLTQPPRCAPTIAHRLQQLYNDCLRHFEQAYINNVLARLGNSQALGQVSAQPSEQQAQPYRPTDADYQALLTSIPPDSSLMTAQAMSILPRFSRTSIADFEAHRIPPHIVQFVEQHRDQLQRAAQDQNGFRNGLTSTENLPLDNRAQIYQASPFQGMVRAPPQFIPNTHIQLLRQALAQAQGKPNTLQPTQLINNGVGVLARPSMAQSMGASSTSSMGTQNTGAGSNSGAQSQSGSMSAPTSTSLTQGGMNGVVSNSILTQSAGAVPIRRPTAEEIASAKRWVEEQRRIAFNRSFEGVASNPPVPDSEIQEYNRNIERLDMVLCNIERYIHIAFAALGKEEVVRRMFAMMASTKFQLEESRKPNPRHVLELHTVRGMIKEAENMDKGLRTALGLKMVAQGYTPVTQRPQQPPSMGPTPSFAAQDQNGFLGRVTSAKNPSRTHPHQQPTKLPPLSEDRFKVLLTRFANATDIRPNYRDFIIDGRPINPWALHRAVFARNGFDTVTANDEWPAVGAALGFPPLHAAGFGQSPRCAPTVARQLQQIYNDSLSHFDQYYISKVLAKQRDAQVLD